MNEYDKNFIIDYIINRNSGLVEVANFYADYVWRFPTEEELAELMELVKKYKKVL